MTSEDDFENPFDITRTEYFNSQYSLIADYFEQPSFYEDLIQRERFIIVGTRGTGKSMILKSLYLPVYVETLKKQNIDVGKFSWKFIGIYVPCDNLNLQKHFNEAYIKYFDQGDPDKANLLWRGYLCNYLSLCVVKELLDTVVTYGDNFDFDTADKGQIAKKILQAFDASGILRAEWPELLEDLPGFFEREMKIFLHFVMNRIMDRGGAFDRPLVDLSFIKDVCSIFIDEVDRLELCRFYILLDDFFPPFVTFRQQGVLLDLVRQRGGPLSFKITTIPEGITYTTDSGYEMRPDLDYSQKFLEYTDVGRGSEYWKLISEITNKRLIKYSVDYLGLFAKTQQTIGDFLKRLKGEVSKGHNRPIYAGFDMIVEMSSGVAGTYLLLVREMINLMLKGKKPTAFSSIHLPIPAEVQNEVIRNRSNLSFGAILSLEHGQSIYKLVSIMGRKSRDRLLANPIAKEYIQYKIKNYGKLLTGERQAHSRLIVAFRNNILHSPDTRPTDRQQNVILRTLILNRLLTPALRIPYRDRWAVDIDAEEISKILLLKPGEPLPITDARPTSPAPQPIQQTLETVTAPVVRNSSCNVFSGEYCTKISELCEEEPGLFLAIPFRDDWHRATEQLIKSKVKDAITALDVSPNGDFTCKICEHIHRREYGIYEMSVLNDNVIFEMGLSIGLGKHTFPIWNKEQWTKRWDTKDSSIMFLIGEFEGLPYFVKEDEVDKLMNKIRESLQEMPWNKNEIRSFSGGKDEVFLALPITSEYYKSYLQGRAIKAIDEVGIDGGRVIDLPSDFKSGLNLINTFRWILRSRICIIDSTKLPNTEGDLEAVADYVWRMFSLGVAVGMRKPLIHCFNSNYTQDPASDLRGKCTFHYRDLELQDKLSTALQEIYNHGKVA